MVCFEYTTEESLIIVTQNAMLYILRPKEEELPIISQIPGLPEGVVLEGAKVIDNSLILLTDNKQVFLINDFNEIKPKCICEKYGGKINSIEYFYRGRY